MAVERCRVQKKNEGRILSSYRGGLTETNMKSLVKGSERSVVAISLLAFYGGLVLRTKKARTEKTALRWCATSSGSRGALPCRGSPSQLPADSFQLASQRTFCQQHNPILGWLWYSARKGDKASSSVGRGEGLEERTAAGVSALQPTTLGL